MNAEAISLLAIAVSLLSALIAKSSLSEAKEARTENTNYKLLNRKTELSLLLSDVRLKGTEVRFLALDCLDVVVEKGLPRTDDGGRQFNLILESLNSIETLRKEIEALKTNLDHDSQPDPVELELLFTRFGGEIRELENQNVILKRIHQWAKEVTGPRDSR